MATKRTGLGRGIGALIPTGTESKGRPSDVFFVGAGLPESAAQVTEEKPAESAPKKTAPKKAAATKEAASPAKTTGRKTPAKAAAKTSEKAPAKRAATRKPVPKPETRATAPVRDAAPEADVESAPSEQL